MKTMINYFAKPMAVFIVALFVIVPFFTSCEDDIFKDEIYINNVQTLADMDYRIDTLTNEYGMPVGLHICFLVNGEEFFCFDNPYVEGLDVSIEERENGYFTVFFVEWNGQEGYQEGQDKLKRAILLRNGTNGTNGRNAVAEYGVEGNCLWFTSYLEGDERPTPDTICGIQGPQGYSIVIDDVPVMQDSVEVGVNFRFWQDRDSSNTVTPAKDLLIHQRTINHGLSYYTAWDFDYVDNGVWISYITTNNLGVVINTGSFFVAKGQDAHINVWTFEAITMIVDGQTRTGTRISVWLDTDDSGDYSAGDEYKNGTIILDGAQGQPGIQYFTYSITYTFNVGDSHFDAGQGWTFQDLSTSQDGLNGMYDGADSGYAITPPYPDSSFVIGCTYWLGSRWDHKITFSDYNDGAETLLHVENGNGNPNFNRNDRSTYNDSPDQFILDLGWAESHPVNQLKIDYAKIPTENYSGYARDYWQYLDDLTIIFAIRVN